MQELGVVERFGTHCHSMRTGNTQCFLALDMTAVQIPNMIGRVLRCSYQVLEDPRY